ncbi:diguanylate cyclase [Granulicella tundricola MP5ACTX9]|uniref:diguanylate cyclase n=2 Tax=Granulicella TaxID=940557 RepID=E8WY09_GRATM|nr:diguanylate cyclase [Granulicella tundricola MP5ACTX9]
MDYRTLFLANIAFMTVYTAFAVLLALHNRKIKGLSLLSAGLVVALLETILQGLDGSISPLWSSLAANELYLLTFVLQMLGLRWFVTRSSLRMRWPMVCIAVMMVSYAGLYAARVAYIGNLINIPVIVLCGTTAWMLLRRGRGLYLRVSRWTTVFLLGEMAVAFYRALLTNLHYALPWAVAAARHDSRWLDSLIAGMFVSSCVVMCDLWFFVTALESELMEQARTDSLTGALNRRALRVEGAREVARTLRSGHTLCLLLLDVDHFKELNDTFGHSAGDAALQYMVQQVRGVLRTQDLLARSGGEEFTILLPETPLDRGELVAERLRLEVDSKDFIYEGTAIHLSVSVGVATLDPHCADFEALMRRADSAMYMAKRMGRNRVMAYGAEALVDDRQINIA